jgi:hypothetical protein
MLSLVNIRAKNLLNLRRANDWEENCCIAFAACIGFVDVCLRRDQTKLQAAPGTWIARAASACPAT